LFATKFHSREVDSSQFITVDEVHSSVAVQKCFGSRCSFLLYNVQMPCKFGIEKKKEKKLAVFMTFLLSSGIGYRSPFVSGTGQGVTVCYRVVRVRLGQRGRQTAMA